MAIQGENGCRVLLEGRTVQASSGQTISRLLQGRQLAVELPCGGNGKCGKCKVRASGCLSPLSREEQALLTPAEIAAQIRLACCTMIEGDCRIELIQDSELAKIAVHGAAAVTVRQPRYRRYGLAVDIGTTTVAMKLFDRQRELGDHSGRNSQSVFGADVITRIDQALHGRSRQIQQVTAAGLNEMIGSLCSACSIGPEEIDLAVITGNTAMLYLLTGSDPDCLAHTPFIADRLFGETVPPGQLGLQLAPAAQVYLTRCLSAYVGGDIASAILASGITATPETALLADIGTNGEMALWHQQRLLCCSTAAGPAFEGAEITMGMNAVPGAIDQLWIADQQIACHVIGDIAPRGLCGSGIIDAVSVLRELELIQPSGAFAKEGLAGRQLAAELSGQPACCLSEGVYLSQRDIRQVQLAKSAICAGMRTLAAVAGISLDEVQTLYLAGGFGNYLNIASAVKIGLLPQQLAAKTRVIGNAALHGAALALTDERFSERELLSSLPVEVVDLAANPVFMEHYIGCMEF